MKRFFAACVLLVLASPLFGDDHPVLRPPTVSTFSIVAIDPSNGDMGVAVASRYFSVGSVVPWALAGVGAVATQANVNVGYGPKGIDLLRQGLSAKQVLDRLLAEDTFEGKDGRQVSIIDAHGKIATYTGPNAPHWAGDSVDSFPLRSVRLGDRERCAATGQGCCRSGTQRTSILRRCPGAGRDYGASLGRERRSVDL